jgi:hypothetical protein
MVRLRLPTVPAHADRWTPALGLAVVLAGLRAVADLFRARLVLARLHTPEILARNHRIAETARTPGRAAPADSVEVHLATHVYPRAAVLVPWRSDCLVQALAAQHRLARCGIATEVVIGVDKTAQDGFQAHAWLRYGNHVVTGGVVDRYEILLETDDTGILPADFKS